MSHQVDPVAAVLDLVPSVPDAVWGAFVGGASAVMVVIVQLWHDRAVRRKEREFGARRDIYLQAVEAIAAAQGVLFNFGRLDLSQQDLMSSFQGYPGWINKVHAVASLSTIDAFRKLGDYFVAAAFDLVKLRFELERLDSQVKNLEERRDQLSRFQAYLLAVARGTASHPPSGLPDLGAAMLTTRAELDKALGEFDHLIEERLHLHVRLVRLCARHGGGFPTVAAPVTLAIRRELEIPIDETSYLRGVDDSAAKMQKQFEDLLAELDRHYGPSGEEPR